MDAITNSDAIGQRLTQLEKEKRQRISGQPATKELELKPAGFAEALLKEIEQALKTK